MSDSLTPRQRSEVMAAVRARDTGPEIHVRRALHARGFRFRLHKRALPGTPDLVLPRYRVAVFVHGCFWHGHTCARGKRPSSNKDFWDKKLDRNLSRDRRAAVALRRAGWRVITVWDCNLSRGTAALIKRLDDLRHASA